MIKIFNPLPNAKLEAWPKGAIYQGFGENVELYKKYCGGMPGHNGIDIITFDGDRVCAAHAGLVVYVWKAPEGYGNRVVIYDEVQELFTVYGHLREDMLVKNGDKVMAGQPIGYEHNSGFVVSGGTAFWGNAPAGKGVHLHFGLVTNAKKGALPGRQFSYPPTNTILTCPADQGIWGYVDLMPYFLTAAKQAMELIKLSVDKKIYLLNADGIIRYIPSPNSFESYFGKQAWLKLRIVSAEELNKYKVGAPLMKEEIVNQIKQLVASI